MTNETTTPLTLTLTLDVRALKAAAVACIQKSKDRSYRYPLHHVALDVSAQGVIAVGMDGHHLIAAKAGDVSPDEQPKVLMIPVETINKLKFVTNFNECVVSFTGEIDSRWGLLKNATGALTYKESSLAFSCPEESYIDWRGLFSERLPESQEAAQFNPESVSKMQEAYSFFIPKNSRLNFVEVIHNGTESARVVFPDADAVGLMMPLRPTTKNENSDVPLWVKK